MDPKMLKLGKAPAVHDPRTLRFSAIRRAGPLPPPEWDFDAQHLVNGARIPNPMLLNDQLGDCVIAGRAHETRRLELLEQGRLLTIADAEVKKEYLKESGGEDGGLIVLDSLKKWRKGWKAGGQSLKIDAFAAVNYHDEDEVRAAIVAHVGIGTGFSLPLSAQDQIGKLWDVTPGRRGIRGTWGGHYIYTCKYDHVGPTFITWGAEQKATWAWWFAYCDEAYYVIDSSDRAHASIKHDALMKHLARVA